MKLFKFLSMMIAAVACTFAFTSCGDDNDEPGAEGQCVIKYKVEFSDTWMDLCDVQVTYTDINGATQTETLTKTTWSKEMSKSGSKTIPANIKVVSTLKPGATLDENSSYKVAHQVSGVTGVFTSSGGMLSGRTFGDGSLIGMSLPGAKALEYIKRYLVIEYSSDKAGL